MRHPTPSAAHNETGALSTATVADADGAGGRVAVVCDGRRETAAVSLGCLVRPLPGDTVMVFRDGGESYVLQVLQRAGPVRATLGVPGEGHLTLDANTITITGRRRLSLRGERLDLQGTSLALIAETTTWLGKVLTGVVDRFRIAARTHETSADLKIEKCTDRTALIAATDSVRAETRVVTVTGMATETAQSKVVAVADDLRMDGKRIAMG